MILYIFPQLIWDIGTRKGKTMNNGAFTLLTIILIWPAYFYFGDIGIFIFNNQPTLKEFKKFPNSGCLKFEFINSRYIISSQKAITKPVNS